MLYQNNLQKACKPSPEPLNEYVRDGQQTKKLLV